MLFIQDDGPAYDLLTAFKHHQDISADGSNSSDASTLRFGGTYATLIKTAGDSSGLQGVKFEEAFPIGSQTWVVNNGTYNIKVYVPDGKNLYGSNILAGNSGAIFVKVSKDDWWRFA
jgi:hypothetical protein